MITFTTGAMTPQRLLAGAPFHQLVMPDGVVWADFFRTAGGYLIRFPGLADYTVSADGTAVVARAVPGTDDATLELLYLNQVMPLAMSRQGVPSFHGSAVTVDDGAVAFLGVTGMGKSTLAASFVNVGATFLTDDGLVLDCTAGGCMVRPNHPSLRLWSDSALALVGDRAPVAPAASYTDKLRLLAGDALRYCAEPKPLRAAFMLSWDDVPTPVIRPLQGAARLKAWIENSFLLDPQDHRLLGEHFDWSHTVSNRVPTFTLDFPRRYDDLPAVRAAILDHVTHLSRHPE